MRCPLLVGINLQYCICLFSRVGIKPTIMGILLDNLIKQEK